MFSAYGAVVHVFISKIGIFSMLPAVHKLEILNASFPHS
jgi:hypothetical protein